jgi:prepilin-type processing-associated H-X9-DG protein
MWPFGYNSRLGMGVRLTRARPAAGVLMFAESIIGTTNGLKLIYDPTHLNYAHGRGSTASCNAVFIDGHVEERPMGGYKSTDFGQWWTN